MLPGETIATGADSVCPDCQQLAVLDVYQSAAGYYIGTYCGCGPYSRESGYYRTRAEAEHDLESGMYELTNDLLKLVLFTFRQSLDDDRSVS